jgi:adenylosuccinate lyase
MAKNNKNNNFGRFENINPVDYRYQPEGRAAELLSEKARIIYQLKVEAALAQALAKHGVCPRRAAAEIGEACKKVTPQEVYAEEEITQHDIRSLVNCIRRKISDSAKPYVHLGATSEDIKQTAESLRLRQFTQEVLVPELLQLEKTLITLSLKHKNTLQIARTHGQHAVPITFGFAMSEYVSRFGNRISGIKQAASQLRGQLSGAVGAYNAMSIIIKDPIAFEADALAILGLNPSTHSTQIIEPEYGVDFANSVISAFGVIANLADDLRHLQRSEIAEVAEKFSSAQVGSSTMPHKRNPWHFENIKSLYKASMPRMITVYLDQISEHQRDLTNSASSRFTMEVLALFLFAVKRMNKYISALVVDEEHMKKNIDANKEMIIAEPLYLILASHGHPDAHEYIKQLTLESQKTGKPLRELVFSDKKLASYVKKFSKEQEEIIRDPAKYTGASVQKAEQVCAYWSKELGI